ncbi:MAG: nucleoside deaminase [Bacteroidales bacterium]|nr:nucleoside deaminase [Bacteroidales bacterium]MCB9014148.1 nucleoside deaminase [Bacteroidales bacterium]
MNYPLYSDEFFMNEALREAEKAFDEDEVPVGAVIVSNNTIIARAHNLTETLSDATAHAEILAITSAENYLGSKYLGDCTLYVSLEPCLMCAAATKWVQLGKIVYGASDPKAGYKLIGKAVLHPATKVQHGILEHECGGILTKFFQSKRKNK